MATNRRIGAEDSATRAALLDAAIALMLEEGYAAVTSRKVAAKAGLKPQLVHYYFRTMDDLFLALVRQGAEQNLARQERALASPQPLRALWELNADVIGTKLTVELSALANHRKAISTELGALADEFRRRQTEALAGALERYGIGGDDIPPTVVMVLMTALSRTLVMEEAIGFTSGHAETRAFVEEWLTRLEGAPIEGEPAEGATGRSRRTRRSG
jgi:AcrR family transcriptional regulator